MAGPGLYRDCPRSCTTGLMSSFSAGDGSVVVLSQIFRDALLVNLFEESSSRLTRRVIRCASSAGSICTRTVKGTAPEFLQETVAAANKRANWTIRTCAWFCQS